MAPKQIISHLKVVKKPSIFSNIEYGALSTNITLNLILLIIVSYTEYPKSTGTTIYIFNELR